MAHSVDKRLYRIERIEGDGIGIYLVPVEIDYQAARNFVAKYVASGGGSYPPVKTVIDVAIGMRDE